jgi:hypothetical protein
LIGERERILCKLGSVQLSLYILLLIWWLKNWTKINRQTWKITKETNRQKIFKSNKQIEKQTHDEHSKEAIRCTKIQKNGTQEIGK